MSFLQISRPIDPIASETIFSAAGFRVNNSTLFAFFILLLIAWFCFFVIRRFSFRPNNKQTLTEIIYEGIEKLLIQITGNRKNADAMLPFIGALFVFIGLSNLLGMAPGLTSFTWGGKPFFRSPTADFNTTFGLALGSILVIQMASIREIGFLGYLGKFFKFKEVYMGFRKGIKDGFIAVIDFCIGLLDIISEIAKIISLSLRLFGNIYAGIVLTVITFGFIAYVAPSIWMSLGILFAVVQAVVFGSLVAAYYILAVKTNN